jgi:Flp pilus assembly pilin Flp
MTFPPRWSSFVQAEDGASGVEYGLLIAGIALVIFGSVMYLGQVVSTNFFKPAENLIH